MRLRIGAHGWFSERASTFAYLVCLGMDPKCIEYYSMFICKGFILAVLILDHCTAKGLISNGRNKTMNQETGMLFPVQNCAFIFLCYKQKGEMEEQDRR